MKKISLTILLFGLFCVILSACVKNPTEIRFGTGGTGGIYFSYSSDLTNLIEKENTNYVFSVKTTGGSEANIRLLQENFLDMALIQSDDLSDVVGGTGNFSSDNPPKFVAVAGLYTEVCQIVVPKDSPIKTIRDLKGKKISVGNLESGTLQNAKEILAAHRISFEMISPQYLDFADSADALELGDIDAFFCTAGIPTKAITNLTERMEIRLLPIMPEVNKTIGKFYTGYSPCKIPAETYAGQYEDIDTVGVKAVLVASTSMKNSDVKYFTEFVFKNAEKISPVTKNLTEEYALTNVPGKFHQGAIEYYKSKNIDANIFDKLKK